MEYVLIPGDVYIRSARKTRHAEEPWKSPSSRLKRSVTAMVTFSRHLLGKRLRRVTKSSPDGRLTLERPGFQLLATCKQAYNDGHYMFYAMNIFHLPPGPVNSINGWFANLRPEHQRLIKTICIDIDLVELTYGGLEAVEIFARDSRGRRPNNYDGNAWSYEALYRLNLRVWAKVLGLYCCITPQNPGRFEGLERVIFQSPIDCYVLNMQLGVDEDEWVSLIEPIAAMSQSFKAIIQVHVNERGWKKTRKRLEGLRRTESRA